VIPPATAQLAVLDLLGHGPATIPMLAAEMINRGERTEHIYTVARLAVRALLDEQRIEECQIHDGPMTYRLPANTPMEPRK
jgi:hypothetical protein